MVSLTNYHGLQVVTPDPVGSGGLAIQNDLKNLVGWHPKSEWNKTSAPGASNDNTQDYYPGSWWLQTNTTPPTLFVCRTSSTGTAVWDTVQTKPFSVATTAKSSNYTIVAADQGQVFVGTASMTFTLTAASTLGAGWWCYIRSSADIDTPVTIARSGSDTIDSLSSVTSYFGELRLVTCSGTAFTTHVLSAGSVRFTSNGTFVVPPGVTKATIDVVDGGGGGGGGATGSAGTLRLAGSGGGGGARSRSDWMMSDIGSAGASITVTVGAATGQAAAGANGTHGNPSSFGTLIASSGGGGAGAGGTGSSLLYGGTGGGTGGAGTTGSTTAQVGGLPGAATSGGVSGGSGAPNTNSSVTGNSSEYGGASGGGAVATGASAGAKGGASAWGGGGGGSGAGLPTANTQNAGGAGGYVGSNLAGGTGATAGTAGGGSGSSGGAGSSTRCGAGGAGGGSNASGTGGAGGDGGTPGGGGGGGGAGTTGGVGGRGARGEVIVRMS